MMRTRLAGILQRFHDRLAPPIIGDLQNWHIGCHVLIHGQVVEIDSLTHFGDHVRVVTTDGTRVDLHYGYPVEFVEPLASIHPLRSAL